MKAFATLSANRIARRSSGFKAVQKPTQLTSVRQFSAFRSLTSTNGLTEEQLQIKDMAASFAENEFKPFAKDWDNNKTFPYETLRKAGELGFGGAFVDTDYGGSGLTRLDGSILFEELSKGCTSTTAFITVHNMASWMIGAFGSEEQKEKFLPKICSMEHITSYCLTEPGNGSDAGNLQTKAVEDGNGNYILNGAKAFISGGGRSDIYVVMARTGEKGPKGISCFIVENGTEGLSFGKNEWKMGWNSQPTSAVLFEDCKVPKENMVSTPGNGFKMAMQGLQGGRLNIGACSLGAGDACFELATSYVKDRKQFGAPLAELQTVQFKLAEMGTKLHLGRMAVREAASLLDEGKYKEANVFGSMAKRVATDAGFEVCNEALQLLGGYGYLNDFPVERYLRDCRVHQILEGTNEIMRVILARDILSE